MDVDTRTEASSRFKACHPPSRERKRERPLLHGGEKEREVATCQTNFLTADITCVRVAREKIWEQLGCSTTSRSSKEQRRQAAPSHCPLPLLTIIDDRPCDRPIQFRGLQATATSGTFSADSTCRLSSSGTRWDVCSLSSSDTVGRLVTRSLVSGWLVCISAVPHNTLSFERRGAPSNRPMTG
jgi:hypothetical protein